MNKFFNSSIQNKANWNIRYLIFSHILVACLVFSIFYQPLYSLTWKLLDEGCSHFLTSTITRSSFWQNFWALANHRIGDAIEDICFVLFFIWLIKTTPKGGKLKKSAEFIFLALLTAAVVIFINNLLFKQIVHIKRHSPSLILDSLPRLSDYISWIKVKSASKASFPSDHSTTAVMFVTNFFLLSKNRPLLITVSLYGIFLCCPRLIAGAHWITDILCGSTSVVLIIFSWALCSPFASFCIKKIHKMLLLVSSFFITPLRKV